MFDQRSLLPPAMLLGRAGIAELVAGSAASICRKTAENTLPGSGTDVLPARHQSGEQTCLTMAIRRPVAA